MKFAKHSIKSELKYAHSNKATVIDFQKIINKQHQVIASLQEEILLLKSYISLEKANNSFDFSAQECSLLNTNSSLNSTIFNRVLDEEGSSSQKNYEELVKQIANVLEIQQDNKKFQEEAVEAIKKYKEIATTKKQPIFVQRIKEIKVPITVEKIVQKQVEKIVYVDKNTSSVTQQTNSKNHQKSFQRPYESHIIYEELREEEEGRGLNKSYSERNINPRGRVEYREKEGKWQDKRFEGNKTGGFNLKRRGLDKYYRKDYY